MSLILGRYEPLEAAPAGAPQRARDLQTAQTVVLREAPLAPDAERAVNRAQAARGICHPSLATLFDVQRLEGDRLLLAYEFVPAQTLARAADGQPFNAKRALEIVAELADAVAALHAHGVVHGGISPATVLLTLKGKAKLDRVGDPSVAEAAEPAADIAALGSLLRDLAAPARGGVAGAQAIEVIASRALEGKFDSAATLAAMLRRVEGRR